MVCCLLHTPAPFWTHRRCSAQSRVPFSLCSAYPMLLSLPDVPTNIVIGRRQTVSPAQAGQPLICRSSLTDCSVSRTDPSLVLWTQSPPLRFLRRRRPGPQVRRLSDEQVREQLNSETDPSAPAIRCFVKPSSVCLATASQPNGGSQRAASMQCRRMPAHRDKPIQPYSGLLTDTGPILRTGRRRGY